MFDDRNRLKTLDWLVPDAREAFATLLAEATRRGYLPSIVSAVRTCAEETNLASNPSGKAKRSWHVLGRAVDIELHLGAPADDPTKFYRELGQWWREQGGTWGGDWPTSFQPFPGFTVGDVMHFQWTPGLGDSPPRSTWPDGLTCSQVDVLQAAALGRSPSSPATSPEKKSLPTLEQGLDFFWLGWALRQRSRSSWPRVRVDAGGP